MLRVSFPSPTPAVPSCWVSVLTDVSPRESLGRFHTMRTTALASASRRKVLLEARAGDPPERPIKRSVPSASAEPVRRLAREAAILGPAMSAEESTPKPSAAEGPAPGADAPTAEVPQPADPIQPPAEQPTPVVPQEPSTPTAPPEPEVPEAPAQEPTVPDPAPAEVPAPTETPAPGPCAGRRLRLSPAPEPGLGAAPAETPAPAETLRLRRRLACGDAPDRRERGAGCAPLREHRTESDAVSTAADPSIPTRPVAVAPAGRAAAASRSRPQGRGRWRPACGTGRRGCPAESYASQAPADEADRGAASVRRSARGRPGAADAVRRAACLPRCGRRAAPEGARHVREDAPGGRGLAQGAPSPRRRRARPPRAGSCAGLPGALDGREPRRLLRPALQGGGGGRRRAPARAQGSGRPWRSRGTGRGGPRREGG